jgi:hypothetical protein
MYITSQIIHSAVGPSPLVETKMMQRENSDITLPRHDDFSIWRRIFECCCIVTAVCLLAVQFGRITGLVQLAWGWLFILATLGLLTADFVSGLVHWTADTWGSETMPILGRRFLRPFRVHHVNPDDFLRREFLDTNGDVAMIVIPLLLTIYLLPIDKPWGGGLAVLLLSFSAAGLPTNQVHQWAHSPNRPRLIRWLQNWGIILSREAHERHHLAPYATNYCIATGWCNRLLTKVDFFRRLERFISSITPLTPRQDDTVFQNQFVEAPVDTGSERPEHG